MKPPLRINLLPVWEARRAGRRRLHRLVEVTAVAATALALLTLTQRAWDTEAGLQTRLRRLRDGVSANRPTAPAEASLRERVKTLRQQLGTLEEIGGRDLHHGELLRSIARSLPDSVWLTRFELSKTALILEGTAKDHKLIAGFLRELQACPHLADSELTEAHQPSEPSGKGNTRFSTRSRVVPEEAAARQHREAPE